MKNVLTALVMAALPLMAVAEEAPDVIITNARVYTADSANRWAEAVAVTGDKITAVGNSDTILSLAGARTRIFNATKHLVVPGFNDALTFETPEPPELFRISLNPNPTANDVRAAIDNAVEETAESPWIVGVIGPKAMADPELTAAALDRASHNRKVMLFASGGLGAILSGSAIQALHLDTANSIGGTFERDTSGRANGKMHGYAVFALRRHFAEGVSDSDAMDELGRFVDAALRQGVTSVQNMSYLPAKKYERLLRHASPPLRIRMIRFPLTTANDVDLTDGADLPARNPERPLSVISGWTWFLDDASGAMAVTPLQLQTIVKAAWETPEQSVFHADAGETIATLFSAMRAAGPPEQWRAKRIAIAGAHALAGELIPQAKEFGIVAIVKPSDPAAKALIAAGIPVAFGSGSDPNPFRDLAQASAISRMQAVDAMTRGAAFAEMAESERGTIAAGKLADLAILSANVIEGPAEGRSLLTMVGGKIAFDTHVLPERRKGDPVPKENP